MKIILLAAGKNSRMQGRISNKSLLKINNKTIIEKLIDNFLLLNLNDIVIVTGHSQKILKNKIAKNKVNIKFIYNKNYKTTNILESIMIPLKRINDDVIITYSDIIYNSHIIRKILHKRHLNKLILPVLIPWEKSLEN